ncbi:MAG: aminotransferase class I/II-fold pyridoxal phosphate-dependent enzyme [Saprospiraceae bacterium]|nr:aminotransferase class I/II-fold pyridoxal phosphate-dependent enzyme [Saprospiraceae bacterium]
MSKSKQEETELIRKQMERTPYREHSAPLFLTSSFVFNSAEQMEALFNGQEEGDIYSRYANPNTSELINKVCHLEEAEAGFATASGMAAVWASMAALLSSGDHILANKAVFGSTYQLLDLVLPRFGIAASFADFSTRESIVEAIRPNTKMLLVESPSNPALQMIDLAMVGKVAREHGIIFNVDNCFCTPILQKPIPLGADIVTHSATKYMDGQGRTLGGLILGSEALIEKITFFCRHTGPAMSPFNAWLLSKSLETLPLRMERHCANALAVAEFLEGHPKIHSVLYPHLPSHPEYELAKRQMRYGGGIVSFEVEGGKAAAQAMLNHTKMCSLSSNLGDSRTILTHPATTTHSKLTPDERVDVGITDGLVRISVGLEHASDIIADLRQALQALSS